VPPGADQSFDIGGFHQDLPHRLRHGSQKITIAALPQQLQQGHSVLGDRVLGARGVAFTSPSRLGPASAELSSVYSSSPADDGGAFLQECQIDEQQRLAASAVPLPCAVTEFKPFYDDLSALYRG
jgi:hypothetical protein